MSDHRAPFTIQELFDNGIQETAFTRMGSKSTNHSSDHAEVDVVIEMNFKPLSNVNIEKFKIGDISECLMYLDMRDGVTIGHEADLHHYVVALLHDVIRAIGKDKLKVLGECSITIERNRGSIRPDLWIVYVNGQPLLVAEVKCFDSLQYLNAPKAATLEKKAVLKKVDIDLNQDFSSLLASRATLKVKRSDATGVSEVLVQKVDTAVSEQTPTEMSILDNKQVLGQTLDYLMVMEQFHGTGCLFGLVTSFKEWRVVGLPGCEELAAAESLDSASASSEAAASDSTMTGTMFW